MQAYSKTYAKVYNAKWIDFVRGIAPFLLSFYKSMPMGQKDRAILDLCCGTGQLAAEFLKSGFRVVGIDLSEHMLHYALENTHQYIEKGQARFVHGDVSNFELDEKFGLVVSTYDALNHLEDEMALHGCFQSVYSVLADDGHFVFDLNTRVGLKRWNRIFIDDSSEEMLVITHGMYDGESDKAWTKVSGFIHSHDSLYERFEEMVFNTVFDLENVRNTLVEIGWRNVYFARIQELMMPIEKPEEESRVYIVAQK